MRILSIDPANMESGYAIIEMPEFKLIEFGKVENEMLLNYLEKWFRVDSNIDVIAIEMVESFGMPVGKDVFETCVWVGRYVQMLQGEEIVYIYRSQEKLSLCGSKKAKDSNIRQALIDRYAKFDFKNGKGVKKNQDTFYGVSKDVWAAIAVGVTYWEMKMEEENT